jgi:4,5-DOPA dioxygenase extradiol
MTEDPVLPTLLVSHGAAIYTAAPEDPTHRWLASLASKVTAARPRAIVVVSAHHVSSGEWTVTSSPRPALVHDHPVKELYGESYAPPGDPELAARIVQAMKGLGLSARTDPERGLDHGAWLPLRAMVPRADVPVVMVSVNARAELEEHVATGRALESLRREGVLLLASGGVTHNQGEFRQRFFRRDEPANDPPAWSVGFDAWEEQTLSNPDRKARIETLGTYAQHPHYANAHPTPDHFWPVIVAAGAAGNDAGRRVHEGFQHGLSMSAFQFGRGLGNPNEGGGGGD